MPVYAQSSAYVGGSSSVLHGSERDGSTERLWRHSGNLADVHFMLQGICATIWGLQLQLARIETHLASLVCVRWKWCPSGLGWFDQSGLRHPHLKT